MESIHFGAIEIVFFLITFIGISLWKAVWVQSKTTKYPYSHGFSIFSLFQWIGVAIGMISIFGGWEGIIALLVTMFAIQAIAGLTFGWLWLKLAEDSYLLPTAFFVVTTLVIVVLGATIAFLKYSSQI